MWLGEAAPLDVGAPTAGASGDPLETVEGFEFEPLVATRTAAAMNTPEASTSASRNPPLTGVIVALP
jgi:hypothetical protein